MGYAFTEESVLETVDLEVIKLGADSIYRGRRAIIRDFYSRMGDSRPHTEEFSTRHLNTNMQIDLKVDEATTIAYWLDHKGHQR